MGTYKIARGRRYTTRAGDLIAFFTRARALFNCISVLCYEVFQSPTATFIRCIYNIC